MRFIFLVPDLYFNQNWWRFREALVFLRLHALERHLWLKYMRADQVFGGTLNIMRHCLVARQCGVDAVLATLSGKDSYGERGLPGLPYISWNDRRPDDVCIVPDVVTQLIKDVEGPVVAYQQAPIFVKPNFNFQDDRVQVWTDSPFMQGICQAAYPGKEIQIVPNIIDNEEFPFIPQSEREPGLIFAFPRKGPEYIAETQRIYQEKGGKYWHFELIDGLTIHELTQQFRRPQAFLASAEVEGCALPPQESMAAGIVVVGRNAKGANFCMDHRETAMIAETPAAAAQCLIELENAELRDYLAQNAYRNIKYYFPSEGPTAFWRETAKKWQHQLQPVQ